MKNLRKWTALAAVMAMTATLFTGCGSTDAPASEATAPAAESTAAATTETGAEAPAADGELAADVQAIVDRGVLRVGVKNAVVGFGFQDTLTELLDSGDIDCVLATFTITDERKQSWDFSTPYFTDYVTVLVEDKSGISSLADLVDKKVGVSSGSTSAKALVKAMIDAGLIDGSGFDADTFDPALWTTGISFQQYDDYPAISTALSAGEVDAFCVDKSILAIYKTDGRSYIDDKFSPQEYGVATTKGSGFSAYVDELVQGWLADGTIDSLITENGLE